MEENKIEVKDTNFVEEKKTEEKTDKRLKNLRPPWKKGQLVNPKGRPKGQRDYKTIYREALLKIANHKGMTEEELENEILKSGILKAKKGNYNFYRDLMDRLHGKPVENINQNHSGEITIKAIRYEDGDNSTS